MKKLLFFVLFTLSLTAQTLSMQECVEQTLIHHPDIKIFMLKVAQSEESYTVSRSDYLPQVALLGEYNPQRTYVLQQSDVQGSGDNNNSSLSSLDNPTHCLLCNTQYFSHHML